MSATTSPHASKVDLWEEQGSPQIGNVVVSGLNLAARRAVDSGTQLPFLPLQRVYVRVPANRLNSPLPPPRTTMSGSNFAQLQSNFSNSVGAASRVLPMLGGVIDARAEFYQPHHDRVDVALSGGIRFVGTSAYYYVAPPIAFADNLAAQALGTRDGPLWGPIIGGAVAQAKLLWATATLDLERVERLRDGVRRGDYGWLLQLGQKLVESAGALVGYCP